jgi:4-alpha-glucanotransferase
MSGRRKSGVLLHPTSLPGPGGIGSFGGECLRFIDALHRAGQTLWQVLPLGPAAYGNSPYSCYSAFAGNPLLIDLEALVQEGDLVLDALDFGFPEEQVDFDRVQKSKLDLLRRAGEKFLFDSGGNPVRNEEFRRFCDESNWLHDYALFMATKEANGGKSWRQWPDGIALRTNGAIEEYSQKLHSAVDTHKYMQWQFFRQWHKIREYANRSSIVIIGDIPIFVAYDSADVWANPELFHLDEQGGPLVVAGVPPDYFSETGQLWGNPLYNWEVMASRGYKWWIERMRCSLGLYDQVRIDHFRGFEAYWEVPASETTAINGRWVKGPGNEIFDALIKALGPLPILAEDLGVITPEVEALRDGFGFPGMKILQFAFGSGSGNPYLPHNYLPHAAVYTGTHDNDTILGWFTSISSYEREHILDYLDCDESNIVWSLIQTAIASVADISIVPLQDILSLDSRARMNVPGVAVNNWTWRFKSGDVNDAIIGRLRHLTELYGRLST